MIKLLMTRMCVCEDYKHETKKLENNEKRKGIDGKFFKNRY